MTHFEQALFIAATAARSSKPAKRRLWPALEIRRRRGLAAVRNRLRPALRVPRPPDAVLLRALLGPLLISTYSSDPKHARRVRVIRIGGVAGVDEATHHGLAVELKLPFEVALRLVEGASRKRGWAARHLHGACAGHGTEHPGPRDTLYRRS